MIKRLLTSIVAAAAVLSGMAQQTNIRYVSGNSAQVTDMVGEDGSTKFSGYRVPGKYTNDGKSWATAKDNIQDAINDLVNNNLKGEVWVAQGTYYPTETTESSGGSMMYMSFKIPAGITVRGGFRGMIVNAEGADPTEAANVTYAGESAVSKRYKITNSTSSVGYYYPYQMILDGSISGNHKTPTFTWNSTKHQYDTEFYGNTYHVVTFATNGFDSDGHGKPLGTTAEIVAAGGELAKLEGAMIKNGYAYNASTDGHPHNAYGGGVYMVPGASLEDVAVEHCVASRDGGGVYMDGGGRCCHVYVADCQALGTSLTSGYGGGICVDENKQIFPPMVLRSAMINCVARYGGGLANRVNNPTLKITAGGKTYDMRYNQGFSAIVVSGCTALTDGGGVYALNGGSFTHMTVVRNACYGTGITVNGMKTGQSAGFYARNNVIIANSILWGGSINDDQTKAAQYASSRSTSSDKAETYYVAMSNVGHTDFTGVKASNTIKLSRYNTAALEAAAGVASNSEEGYANFLNPLENPGYLEGSAALHFKAYEIGSSENNGISYKVAYTSACTNRGVPTSDLDTEGRTPTSPTGQQDVFGTTFSSNPTLGAYTSTELGMSPDVEYTTGTTTYGGKTYGNAIAHVFVDPNTQSEHTENVGSAWDKPVKKLADALNKIGEVASARLPQIEKYGYTITKIIVHVKEGNTTVQGADATGSIRASSLVIPDVTVTRADDSKFTIPLEILGGYKSDIEDDLTKDQTSATFPARHGYAQAALRNPILYPSVVTGYVMDDYAYTTPHLFKIEDISGAVTIDGLQVRFANAWSQKLDNTVTTGGAFTIRNSSNVNLKNILIAHCQASNGPAIYETGNSNVSLENCILHNNTINVAGISGGNFEKGGIVYVENGSTMTVNHCDVLRNVGYAFYNDGTVTMDNSICYANMTTALDDTNGNEDKAMKTFAGSGTVNSDDSKNLFDTGSASDSKATGIGTANQEFVFVSGIDNKYPSFVNPTKNSGVSEDGDATYYGLSTSFEPQNTSDCINAASTAGVAHRTSTTDDSWGTDMSTNINRDYGGLPDIGAIESHKSFAVDEGDLASNDGQREYGTLYYVKYYDGDLTKGGDGMSWATAINGNAYYDETTGTFYGSEATHTEKSGKHIGTITKTTTRVLGEKTTTISTDKKYLLRKKDDTEYAKLSVGTYNVGFLTNATLFKWGTANEQTADYFTFTEGSYTTGYGKSKKTVTAYVMYNGTLGKYFQYDHTKGTQASDSKQYYQMTISGNKIKFHSINANLDRYLDIETNNGDKVIYQVENSSDGQDWELVPFTETTKYDTTWVYDETTYYHMNGLQYAVNRASNQFSSDRTRRAVWVAAGTYKKDPETRDGYYFDIDENTNTNTDESCFIIRDGVDVLGAFPNSGNPCENQREALLSQYIKVRADKSDYTVSDYETILQPTSTIAVGKTCRVLGQPYACNPSNSSYTTYDGATWDGFTIRNGFLDASKTLNTTGNGGAGATVYNNVTLKNCVITDNTNFAPNGTSSSGETKNDYRGGGMVVRGGSVQECYIINNNLYDTGSSSSTTESTGKSGVAYGGGLYFNSGTIYNCVIAKNSITAQYADGAGFFIDGAVNCYNNTIAYNTATGTGRASGGVCVWSSTGAASQLQIFNTICEANTGLAGQVIGTKDISIALYGGITLTNCISETNTNLTGSNSKGSSSITFNNCKASTDYASIFSDVASTSAFTSMDLRLKSGSPAINAGLDAPTLSDGTTIDLSAYTDMDFEDRIQDCTIDIGAYEYNNAYDITPDVESEEGKAIYYVTPEGYGSASAQDPENAACASKLQKVLDAAGRYKYQNPTTQVIVKVANNYSMYHATESTNFTYYACRTTDDEGTDQDTRIWSIIVPRGVEIWGGYTDVASDHTKASWSNTNNGFYSGSGSTYKDLRDVINNPTYFDAEYHNSDENTQVYAYHVVAFTNKVYDGNGTPYKTGDDILKDASASGTVITLDDTFGRGIVDGIFITGGQADAASTSSKNNNMYGGAAIVGDYGHVRNCIIRYCTGDYGGAIALAKGGLVSGCLIDQNIAIKKGGGIYVLTDDENKNLGITTGGTPHVYTSTIANNTAEVQGGGLCFDDKDNVRVNSSVIWQNHCSDMADVAGTYSPEKASDDATGTTEYYPIAYSAIQNLRASGTNNISIASENKNGARFWQNYYIPDGETEYATQTDTTAIASENDFNEFGLYKLTHISQLLRVGMPVDDYKVLSENTTANKATYIGLAENDFANVDREANTAGTVRTYIDMGARALDKVQKDKELMLRLFVAQAEDVDADAETDFSLLTGTPGSDEEYYSQQGSSFAYPFHSLQDALDYIYTKRGAILSTTTEDIGEPSQNANLLPFEICVAKGTYYPTKDLIGNYGQSFSNTFAIPEGVSVFGGFNATELGDNTFYGRYYKAKSTLEVTYNNESTETLYPSYIINNIEPVNGGSTKFSNDDVISGYKIIEALTDTILDNREREDVNANSILEPWEFKNQTILSGTTVGDNQSGVFHVLTFVPDQNVVGVLPPKGLNLASTYDAETDATKQKYLLHEQGQYSVLNGLIITKGHAYGFANNVNMDEYSKNNYYAGGGMQADGNRYNDNYGNYLRTGSGEKAGSVDYKHTGVTDPAAYRDQVVTINQCKFLDNEAGYGGAIASNSTTDIYNSTFENNLAVYGVDKNVPKDGSTIEIWYPGQGGAIQNTYQLAAYNTVFANNEARSTDYTIELKKFPTYRNPDGGNISMFSGIGGAVYSGFQAHFHLVNCDIVRNMANHYPAVFTRNPNVYTSEMVTSCSIDDYNQMLNTVVWGNEINSTMAAKFRGNDTFKFAADLICNYGAPDRDTWKTYGVNYGSNPTVPTDQEDLDNSEKWVETAWFSAYEKGRGVSVNNKKDIRDSNFRPYLHAISQITSAAGAYQNCNVQIDSLNNTLEGPNFSGPSQSAGCDGYMESADWSPARLNNLTDNGSGKILQKITKNSDETYECKFPTFTEAGYSSVADYDSPRVTDPTTYSNETTSDYVTNGIYTVARYCTPMNYTNSLPLGEKFYMKSLNGTDEQQMLYRVSYDPNPTHNSTYIDIGVYEYPHTPLKYTTEGDECDILWVSSVEKPDNGLPEGSAWSQPTSDLQRAIETLLSSRNGHRKEIRLMDGTYSPVYTIEGKMSFYVDTKYLNESVVLPTSTSGGVTTSTEGLGVKSLTIKGGYSKDLNDQYDINQYPAIIRQKQQTESGTGKWDHLFYVKDATQRYGSKTEYNENNGYGWYSGTTAAGTAATAGTAPTTIPIQIDGVSFVNTQADGDEADGAAIYYADQAFGSDFVQTEGATKYLATAPTKANVSLMDADGNRLYWTSSEKTATQTEETDYPAYVEKTAPYKFILSRSTVMNSGSVNDGKVASAAYVGKFGGEALVYNSVFHSNRGDALKAYATKTINNTFALNYGKMVLNDKTGNSTYDGANNYNSTIYNSVFWRNNNGGSGETYDKQFNLNAASGTCYDGTVTDGTITTYDYIKSNAYTGGNVDAIEYDASKSQIISGNNYNVGLSNSNTDAVYGPNFVDPNESAETDEAREARDFMIAASLRLLNRGDNNTAHDAKTGLYCTGDLTASPTVWGTIYDYAWITATNTDAASSPRVITKAGGVIDLGAYEYQSKQNRVLYVDPNKLASGTGLSWSSPLGYGNIQAAIDACAVYYKNEHKQTYVFVKANSGTNLGQHSGETLTMRNGVAVYGSVVSDYLEDCSCTKEQSGDYTYSDATLAAYVNGIKVYHRNGILSPTEGHTRIYGINTNGTAFDEDNTCSSTVNDETTMVQPIAVMDGFDVTAQTNASSDEMAKVTAPVININPKTSDTGYATGKLKMALHNIAVHGNNYADGGKTGGDADNLINIDNALLYEALVYNNSVKSTASILKVGEYGYAASVTVADGKTTGADGSYGLNNCSASNTTAVDGVDHISGNMESSHVYNSITNFGGDPATWKTMTAYCYKMDHQGFDYQLTEKSKYIDAITVDKDDQSSVLGDMPGNFSFFIHYWPTWDEDSQSWSQADRDVLGNFRLQTLGGVATTSGKNYYEGDYTPKLDRGACETWDVQRSTLNVFPDFPHDGSVEYIRAGKSLIIDPIIDGVVNSAHEPGFVLLEMGANLYGNGRRVEVPYVSIQSYIPKASMTVSKAYVMSTPFRMDYSKTTEIGSDGHSIGDQVAVQGIGNVSYDSDGGLVYEKTPCNIYTYDGAGRSASDFEFNTGITGNSDCWKYANAATVEGGRGILLEYTGDVSAIPEAGGVIYRVTSKGVNFEDNVYLEEVNFADNHVYHTITLDKYDDSESTGGKADYTDANDQGWNCIGLPYLVCNYYPYYKAKANITGGKYSGISIYKPTDTDYATVTGASYAMTNPKTMWLYYNGKVDSEGKRLAPDGTDDTMGEGGFYSVNSWDYTSWHSASGSTPRIWMGEGFFVQNQKFSGDEELKFYVPVPPTLAGSSSSARKETYGVRYYFDETGVDEMENGNSDADSDAAAPRKVLINGRVYILRDGHRYTIDGTVVE